MSKRSRLYRHLKHETPEETAAVIMDTHHLAKDIKGQICSRPMWDTTALRIALCLHARKS